MNIGLFIHILRSLQNKGCFNDTGTMIIQISIYVDERSRHAIANYVHKSLEHRLTKHIDPDHQSFENAHLKHYFNDIFNRVNHELSASNVQLKADYSDLGSNEHSSLLKTYCRSFLNIVDATERFLSEAEDPHKKHRSKIIIFDCHENNSWIANLNHHITKNECGKVLGFIMDDPSVINVAIEEELFRMINTRRWASAVERLEQDEKGMCSNVTKCSTEEKGFGYFDHRLEKVIHKTLFTERKVGLNYGTVIQEVIDFSHPDSKFNFEHYANHHGPGYLNNHMDNHRYGHEATHHIQDGATGEK